MRQHIANAFLLSHRVDLRTSILAVREYARKRYWTLISLCSAHFVRVFVERVADELNNVSRGLILSA